jgi:ribosomal protein S18 acetylase RimI-like enzyme
MRTTSNLGSSHSSRLSTRLCYSRREHVTSSIGGGFVDEPGPLRLQKVSKVCAPGGRETESTNTEFGQMIRGASYLRAFSFGSYPPGRSEYAKRSHLLMTAADALQQMESGLDAALGESFFTVVATLTRDQISGDTDALNELDDAISKGVHVHLPSGTEGEVQYVCGTLDVTIGAKLPSEELIGRRPDSYFIDKEKRGYLSNVCVLKPLRKRGIAQCLIQGACSFAQELGVSHMYVHVVEDNVAARKLYEDKCRFQVEQKESANVARGLNRPQRLLLYKNLHV